MNALENLYIGKSVYTREHFNFQREICIGKIGTIRELADGETPMRIKCNLCRKPGLFIENSDDALPIPPTS